MSMMMWYESTPSALLCGVSTVLFVVQRLGLHSMWRLVSHAHQCCPFITAVPWITAAKAVLSVIFAAVAHPADVAASCSWPLLSHTPGLCLEQHSSPSFTQRILTIQLCCDVTGFAPSSHCCQLAARAFLDLHAPPKLYCQVTLSAAAPPGPTRASLQAPFVVGQWHVQARSRVLQPCPGAICGEEAHSSVQRCGQGGQEVPGLEHYCLALV